MDFPAHQIFPPWIQIPDDAIFSVCNRIVTSWLQLFTVPSYCCDIFLAILENWNQCHTRSKYLRLPSVFFFLCPLFCTYRHQARGPIPLSWRPWTSCVSNFKYQFYYRTSSTQHEMLLALDALLLSKQALMFLVSHIDKLIDSSFDVIQCNTKCLKTESSFYIQSVVINKSAYFLIYCNEMNWSHYLFTFMCLP